MNKKFIIKICLKSQETVIFAELIWRNKDVIIMRNAFYKQPESIVYLTLSINLSYITSITKVSDEEYIKYKNTILNAPGNNGTYSDCACKEINDEIKNENTEEQLQKNSEIYKSNIKKNISINKDTEDKAQKTENFSDEKPKVIINIESDAQKTENTSDEKPKVTVNIEPKQPNIDNLKSLHQPITANSKIFRNVTVAEEAKTLKGNKEEESYKNKKEEKVLQSSLKIEPSKNVFKEIKQEQKAATEFNIFEKQKKDVEDKISSLNISTIRNEQSTPSPQPSYKKSQQPLKLNFNEKSKGQKFNLKDNIWKTKKIENSYSNKSNNAPTTPLIKLSDKFNIQNKKKYLSNNNDVSRNITITTNRNINISYKEKKYKDLNALFTTLQSNIEQSEDSKDWGIRDKISVIEKGKKLFNAGKINFYARRFY